MNPVIYVAGWTLLHFLWQGALIGVAVAVALWLLRAASAQTRYLVASVTLAATLWVPLLTARQLMRVAPAGSPNAGAVRPASGPTAAVTGAARAVDAVVRRGDSSPTALPRADPRLAIVVVSWLIGTSLLLIRLAGGWWRVRRLHQASVALPISRWQPVTTRLANRLGVTRRIHVVDSSLVDVPVVIGWLQPVILLPIAAFTNLSPAQVSAILSHELAHVRRHDALINLLQTVAETLLFYHPAVWWLAARIRAEREHCCDDVAVQVCADPVGYVAALVELETWRMRDTRFGMASTGGSLAARVKRLLDRRSSGSSPWSGGIMMVAAVLPLTLAIGAVQHLPAAQPADRLTPDSTEARRDESGSTRRVSLPETRWRVADVLGTAVNDGDASVRREARLALAAIPSTSDDSLIIESPCRGNCTRTDTPWTFLTTIMAARFLNSDDPQRRVAAVGLLPRTTRGAEALAQVLTDSDPEVRTWAAIRLDSFRSTVALPGWALLLTDGDASLRERAAISLGIIGDARAIDPLTGALNDPDPVVRRQAVRALANIALGDDRVHEG